MLLREDRSGMRPAPACKVLFSGADFLRGSSRFREKRGRWRHWELWESAMSGHSPRDLVLRRLRGRGGGSLKVEFDSPATLVSARL
jgi:hypothetical protein